MMSFLGAYFDGVHGCVSVKNRRIWTLRLAIEEALRRNALSGPSLRRLVGLISYAFLLRRPCLSISFKRVRLH